MKKILSVLVCMFAVTLSAKAVDKPVTVTELPKTAQKFIKDYMSDKKVSFATQDTDLFDGEYKIVFTDGTKVEFSRNGQWKDVECKNLTTGVVSSFLPTTIKAFIAENYPNDKIIDIEYDNESRGGYEIKLSSKAELKFNKKGAFIGID